MLNSTPNATLPARAEADRQLRGLRAQLDEIICLLEGQAPCPSVLRQIFSAQAALHATERLLLQHHLRACLQGLHRMKDEAACQQSLADVRELYGLRRSHAVSTPTRRDSAVERGYS